MNRRKLRRRLHSPAALRIADVFDRILGLEALEQRCLLTVDFGDVRQFDPALLSDNGVRHEELGAMPIAIRAIDLDSVTIVSLAATDQLLEVEVVVTDLNGNPISTVNVGDDFKVSIFVQDLRNPPNSPGGAFSVFLEMAYDSPLVTIDSQFADAGPRFVTVPQPINVSTPGLIPGFTTIGFAAPANPAAAEKLWSIVVHASSAGVAHFLPSFDAVEQHEVVLFGYEPPS